VPARAALAARPSETDSCPAVGVLLAGVGGADALVTPVGPSISDLVVGVSCPLATTSPITTSTAAAAAATAVNTG
jgi:hypothetical protein